ncbi:hypothetical protein M408DRAFT_307767 [Serendipita vermifera MAFF 305830]|uniref:Uncharacterized protein n=1 Tax=Serendipita vermifera MAFF 305830 TaxID=933852 RepID=A0A0C3AK69_SERVB|nr:hypothetical protein M408DRAFT_307767 [Serendipita vermifera MAFF 305830]
MPEAMRNIQPSDVEGNEKEIPLDPRLAPVPNRKIILQERIQESVTSVLSLLMELLMSALRLLKRFIALTIIVYVILVLLSKAPFILPAFDSICTTPLSSVITLCNTTKPLKAINFAQQPRFSDLVTIQMGFEHIMEPTGLDLTLPFRMQRIETAVGDLNALVEVSNLESKDLISSSLDAFAVSARNASRLLSRLESGVGGAVDLVLAADSTAIRSLESIEKREQNRHVISTIINSSTTSKSRKKIVETYIHTAEVTESTVLQLIEKASVILAILDQLESQMVFIHEVVSREGETKQRREEVLVYLWTRLGASRDRLELFAEHHSLLSQVENCRLAAATQVKRTLEKLEKLAAEVDDLRDDVEASSLGHEATVSLRTYIETLEKGVQRLSEERDRAKVKKETFLRIILDGHQHAGIGQ